MYRDRYGPSKKLEAVQGQGFVEQVLSQLGKALFLGIARCRPPDVPLSLHFASGYLDRSLFLFCCHDFDTATRKRLMKLQK